MYRIETIFALCDKAEKLLDEPYNEEALQEIFESAAEWNDAHPGAEPIFVCHIEDGICIEDDFFVYER